MKPAPGIEPGRLPLVADCFNWRASVSRCGLHLVSLTECFRVAFTSPLPVRMRRRRCGPGHLFRLPEPLEELFVPRRPALLPRLVWCPSEVPARRIPRDGHLFTCPMIVDLAVSLGAHSSVKIRTIVRFPGFQPRPQSLGRVCRMLTARIPSSGLPFVSSRPAPSGFSELTVVHRVVLPIPSPVRWSSRDGSRGLTR